MIYLILPSSMSKLSDMRIVSAELSSIQKPFKFLAVSRPVDITPLINECTALLAETVERQFYIRLCNLISNPAYTYLEQE